MNIRRIAFASFALAAILAPCIGAARADVVVSDLDDTTSGAVSIFSPASPTNSQGTDVGQQFATGGRSYTLTGIEADLDGDRFTSGVAYLLGDAGGKPGSLLATFNFPSVPHLRFGAVTFTPTSSVTLSAGAEYWFVVGDRDSSQASTLSWAVGSEATTGPGSLGGFAGSLDQGVEWLRATPAASPHLKIQVDGTPVESPPSTTAVPEPSSALAVGVVALAALGVWARKRSAAWA